MEDYDPWGSHCASGGSFKTGPFGTALKASEYTECGVPVISVGEVLPGALVLRRDTPRVSPSVTSRLSEYLLMSGDIVFGRKGAVDRSAWVKPAEEGWFLGSDGIRVRLPGSVDSRFVAYQLQSESVRAWLLQHSGGSTLLSLNQSTLSRVSLLLPPLADQRAIAEVLGALDDKIAANTKLTSMADVLGKGLFSKAVQAGTVRRVLLREIANNVPGKYLAKDDYENDGLYYVYGSNSVMGKHDKATAPGGFAVLAKIGSYCGNLLWSQRPAWVNNNASACSR